MKMDDFRWLLAQGVSAMHQQHGTRGWFYGHELVGWLSQNHNAELNDLYQWFGHEKDPRLAGHQQIELSLLHRLGQNKINDIDTAGEIPPPPNDGRYTATRWLIDETTTKAVGDYMSRHWFIFPENNASQLLAERIREAERERCAAEGWWYCSSCRSRIPPTDRAWLSFVWDTWPKHQFQLLWVCGVCMEAQKMKAKQQQDKLMELAHRNALIQDWDFE